MPADIELGVTFNTDQAVKDLESDLDDVSVGTSADSAAGGAGGGAGGELATGLGVEAGSDIASGGGKGGILGQLAGGIGKLVGLVGAIVGFLALMEPVQQALGFLKRQFELLLIPVLTALRPLLSLVKDFTVQILRFLRNPDAFVNAVKNALAPFANAVISGLNAVPGVDIDPIKTEESGQTGFRSSGRTSSRPEQVNRTKQAGDLIDDVNNPAQAVAELASSVAFKMISDDGKVEKTRNKNSSGVEGNLNE